MANPASDGKGAGTKLVVQNRRAGFDYALEDRYEAGISLVGTEVKTLRGGKGSLAEAWVRIDDHGEAWLMQAHIPEYDFGNINNHVPTRERKLLLHRSEIDRLAKATREQGVAIVPTRLYFKNGKAKVEIAVGHGKNVADKRRDMAKKDAKRDIERALKQRSR